MFSIFLQVPWLNAPDPVVRAVDGVLFPIRVFARVCVDFDVGGGDKEAERELHLHAVKRKGGQRPAARY
jgi:hypothetical protein